MMCIQTSYEVGVFFFPTLVQTICSVVVCWCSGISGGDAFVLFGDWKILSFCDLGIAYRCRQLRRSFRPFSVRMRYELGCSHLLITFPILDQVLASCKWTWSLLFRGWEFFFLYFLCVCFEALSWYVGCFILGSNVRKSRFICFVAGDGVLSLPDAAQKASNVRPLSSPDFKHFNRVLLTV